MNNVLTSCTDDYLKIDPSMIASNSDLLFEDVYDLDDVISEGCYGTIFKVFHRSTNHIYAAKILSRIDQKSDEIILKEVSLLRDLKDVPNVVQIIDFFVDDDYMYIVQDYAQGGDVIEELIERGAFNEIDACDLTYVLLQTIRTLQDDYKMVHRDIKPDNILLKNPNDYSSALLCDFGFATYLPKRKNDFLSRRCGSVEYTAPEIIQSKKYREQVDMWSIGCTLFLLLTGDQAFEDETMTKTVANIVKCSYDIDHPKWDSISDEAKELIENLLVLDPNQRWTVNQALTCDWITQNIEQSAKNI